MLSPVPFSPLSLEFAMGIVLGMLSSVPFSPLSLEFTMGPVFGMLSPAPFSLLITPLPVIFSGSIAWCLLAASILEFALDPVLLLPVPSLLSGFSLLWTFAFPILSLLYSLSLVALSLPLSLSVFLFPGAIFANFCGWH